jgi:outer membrane protein assembly factor BamB
MRYLQIWIGILSANPEVTLVMAGAGLFFLLAAWWLLRRRRAAGQLTRTRITIILVALVFGLFLSGSATVVISRWPPAFQQKWMEYVHGDFANEELMRSLQATNLEVALPAPDLPGEWPQWRGPRRDGISRESGLNWDWTNSKPAVAWRTPIGAGYSSVIVSGGRLYTQDRQAKNERVLCLSADKGALLWSHSYPTDYAGFWSHDNGPRATPTVYDGRVYTVGATGVFLCLEANPADGQAKVLWQHNLLADFEADLPSWGVACSPLIEGRLVIVQPGGEKGSVVAFDRITGQLAWTALDDPNGYSSPVAATAAGVRQIVAFTGERLVGLRPEDGKQLWDYPWVTSHKANIATPVVAGDTVFISSDYGAGCALVKLSADGNGAVKAEPVYVKRNKLMRNHHSTCVLHKGLLFGCDTQDNTHIRLRCLDLVTGEEKWATPHLGKVSPLLVDGHILLQHEDGDLILIEATGEAYRERGRLSVFAEKKEVWALPALAAGRLYLRNHKEVVCVELKK